MDLTTDRISTRHTSDLAQAPGLPAGTIPACDLAAESSPPATEDDDLGEDNLDEAGDSSPDDGPELDEVDEASKESFPASDPPSFTPLHIGP